MKHPLLTGIVVTAMMMMAAPTAGSPIIVFSDEGRDACVSQPILWTDPWSPFAFNPELLDRCEDAEPNPFVVSSRGLIRLGGGMGIGLAGGLQTLPPLAVMLSAGLASAVEHEPLVISEEPLPPSLSAPPDETLPTRESSTVDVTERPATDLLEPLISFLDSSTSEFPPPGISASTDVGVVVALNDLSATNPAVVPEPGSLLLLGTGLLLAALRRNLHR